MRRKTPKHKEEIRRRMDRTIDLILFAASMWVGGFVVAMVALPVIIEAGV